MKWINFPWKINIFCKYWTKYDDKIVDNIGEDILSLIGAFAFGNNHYLQTQLTAFKMYRQEKNVVASKSSYQFPWKSNS